MSPLERGSAASNPTSSWVAGHYTDVGSFVPALGAPVVDLLNPQHGEHILDLGCGDGALTQVIAERGATVVGIDASPDLVRTAQSRGLDARLGSGEHLEFDEEFDAVFSNAALHWMLDADAVVSGVVKALRPGGRFVVEMGGFGNIAAVLTALSASMEKHGYPGTSPRQFYPTVQQYDRIATAGGLIDFAGELILRPTPLDSGMASWLRTFRQGFLDHHGVPPERQELVIADTVELLRPALCDVDGNWFADYVRLRFTARKPS